MENVPIRKQLRMSMHDYSEPGAYFVTICVENREPLLAKAVGAHSVRPSALPLTDYGKISDEAINTIPHIYPNVIVKKYVIMPDHIHMILIIKESADNGRTVCAPTISRIIKQLKEHITKQIGFSMWQKSFYDRIIRNREEYYQIVQYIETNPEKLEYDDFN